MLLVGLTDLMDAGVKVYEYTPGFVHCKQVLADDEMAVVGSINFDLQFGPSL